jgi:hypothetical protein
LWEASLCLRAHGEVSTGDDDGRFLRQAVEEIVGKQKNPKSLKRRNKLIKQMKKEKANKMPL